MKKVILLVLLTQFTQLLAADKIKVLIIDGQNNHQWVTTTPLLKEILDDTGRFVVDVSTSPPAAPKAKKMNLRRHHAIPWPLLRYGPSGNPSLANTPSLFLITMAKLGRRMCRTA